MGVVFRHQASPASSIQPEKIIHFPSPALGIIAQGTSEPDLNSYPYPVIHLCRLPLGVAALIQGPFCFESGVTKEKNNTGIIERPASVRRVRVWFCMRRECLAANAMLPPHGGLLPPLSGRCEVKCQTLVPLE